MLWKTWTQQWTTFVVMPSQPTEFVVIFELCCKVNCHLVLNRHQKHTLLKYFREFPAHPHRAFSPNHCLSESVERTICSSWLTFFSVSFTWKTHKQGIINIFWWRKKCSQIAESIFKRGTDKISSKSFCLKALCNLQQSRQLKSLPGLCWWYKMCLLWPLGL